jgi:hypothetical protein
VRRQKSNTLVSEFDGSVFLIIVAEQAACAQVGLDQFKLFLTPAYKKIINYSHNNEKSDLYFVKEGRGREVEIPVWRR